MRATDGLRWSQGRGAGCPRRPVDQAADAARREQKGHCFRRSAAPRSLINPPSVQHRQSNRASRAAPLRRSALVVPDSGSRRCYGASSLRGRVKQPCANSRTTVRLGVGVGQPKGGGCGPQTGAGALKNVARLWGRRCSPSMRAPARSAQGRPRSRPARTPPVTPQATPRKNPPWRDQFPRLASHRPPGSLQNSPNKGPPRGDRSARPAAPRPPVFVLTVRGIGPPSAGTRARGPAAARHHCKRPPRRTVAPPRRRTPRQLGLQPVGSPQGSHAAAQPER